MEMRPVSSEVRARLALTAGLGVLVPVACLAVPPFHVLGHEFTALFSAVTACGLYLQAVSIARRSRATSPTQGTLELLVIALHRSLVWALPSGIAGFCVMLTANALRFGCDVGKGVAFFWVTWLPLTLVACAIGVVIGFSTDRRSASLGLMGLAICWTIVQDVMQGAFGPHTPVDFFLGSLLALLQRAQAGVPEVHLWQRCYLLLFGFLVWNVNLWRCLPNDHPLRPVARVRAILALALFVGIGAHQGTYVGVGWWGHGRLERSLPGTLRTEHFDLFYQPAPYISRQIRAVARRAEWSRHQLARHWPIRPTERVRIYVMDQEHLVALTGMTPHANVRTIFITPWAATSNVLLHELVHAFTIDLEPHPFVIFSRGLSEGLAHAHERDYLLAREAHTAQAAALEARSLPPARQFMGAAGFWKVEEGQAYEAAGSFVGFLVLKYGIQKLFALYRGLEFAPVYGRSIDELDQEWRAFLREVPRDAIDRIQASRVFDGSFRPSFTSRPCPKLGSGREDPEVVAERLWDQEAWAEALAAFEELHRGDGKARWLRAQAGCLEKLNRLSDAVATLDRALKVPDLPAHERSTLLAQKIRCLARTRRWADLDAVLQGRESIDLAVEDRMIGLALKDPKLRDRMAEALNANDHETRRTVAEELLRLRPDSVASLYFHATWALPYSLDDRGLAAWKQIADLAPEHAGKVAEHLMGQLERSVTAAEYDRAARVGKVLGGLSLNPLFVLRMRRELDRADFERSVRLGLR
ncbi:MAG: hypothetical protein HY815_17975 [Candidatus Riflebacteria bacterium]|nr:hypothetical protein [Candidatus Riflebacteria bacterium]